MKSKILLAILFSITAVLAFGQRTVSGKIYDAQTKEPLVGASVSAIGTAVVTRTDNTGNFNLNTDASTLQINYIGYDQQTVEVPENGRISLAVEPAVWSLDAVVVTASRDAQKRSDVPMAISKLSPQLISDTKPIALNEIISKVPGVYMMRLGGESHNMSIRQPLSTSPYFLYLEDGIPIRPMGLFSHGGLNETNIMALNSIEVVKGPASSIYGPEAVGGAVNLITNRPTVAPTFRIGYQGDEYNYNRVQYSAGGMLTKKLGAYVGGYFGGQRDGWRERTDYIKNSVNARLDYNLSLKTQLTAAYAYNFYDGPEALSLDSAAYYSRSYEASNDFMYRKISAHRSRLTLNHRWNERSESFITAFHRYNDTDASPSHTVRWTSKSSTATSEKSQSLFNSYGVIAQHVQRFNFLQAKLMVGGTFDYTPQEYDAFQIGLTTVLRADSLSVKKYLFKEDRPNVLIADYKAKIRNTGFYAQFEINPLNRLKLILGARYDLFAFDYDNYLDKTLGEKSYDQISPKVGVTYDLGRSNGLYANYGLGFAPPGVTAIFRRRPNAQPGEELFYYNLGPAQFINMEVGGWFSLIRRKLSLDASLYRMEGRNELLQIRQPDNSTDYQSAGQTLHQGIELGFNFTPNPQWALRVGGAVAKHEFVDFELSAKASDAVQRLDGYEMPAAPRLILNTELSYKPRWFKGFHLSLESQYLSPWYVNQINTIKYEDKGFLGLPGVSILNVRVGYEFRGIELFLNVLNASDELYVTGTSRGNGPNDRQSYSPNAPRTVGFGVQYNFVGKAR